MTGGPAQDRQPRCHTTVYWYDIEITARCVRPEGHEGLHRDGIRWFDELGLQRPTDVTEESVTRGAAAGWKELAGRERSHAPTRPDLAEPGRRRGRRVA